MATRTVDNMALVLLVISAVVISPFFVYYVTSALFFRRANSKANGKRPPTLPYFVPGVFSTGGLIRSGTRKYFANIM